MQGNWAKCPYARLAPLGDIRSTADGECLIEVGQEDFDDSRIELGSASVSHHRHRFGQGQCRPIAAVGQEGVENVCNRCYPTFQWNLFAN